MKKNVDVTRTPGDLVQTVPAKIPYLRALSHFLLIPVFPCGKKSTRSSKFGTILEKKVSLLLLKIGPFKFQVIYMCAVFDNSGLRSVQLEKVH